MLAALAMTTQTEPTLEQLIAQVDARRLRAAVERLAAFHTRNTLSPGLAEAAEWLAGEYRKIPGLQVELMRYVIPKGRRVPEDKEVVQVVATLPGTAARREPGSARRIIVGGHLDSLNLQVDPASGRAPGANDDGSGVALALEMARIMARRRWANTVMFVGWSGEEQGLNGSRAMAQRAKAEGWTIDAVLSNDTVGSSANKHGMKDARRVRVYSEEHNPEAESQAPHNSRELARFIEYATRGKVRGFAPMLVFRRDRFGRGGDHTPFVQEGFSAVRFIERYEEFTRQHTPDDLPQFMDWTYLANVTRLNLAAVAQLADAAPAPTVVRLDQRQSHDTTITWSGAKGASFIVYWRETTSPVWQGAREVGVATRATIERVNKDDHFFAVGSVGGVPVPAR